MARSLTWRCCAWCLTEDEKSAARIDQEINKILLEQKKRDRGELKLLLLGESAATPGGTAWEPTFRMSRLRPGSSSQGVSCGPVPRSGHLLGICRSRGGLGRRPGFCQAGPARPIGSALQEGNEPHSPGSSSLALRAPPVPLESWVCSGGLSARSCGQREHCHVPLID